MFIKGMIKDCYLAKQPKITDNTYNVSITGDTDDLILYTVDGTDPIINGKVYNAPFRVDKDCIVEARAVNEWSHSSSAFADVKKSKSEIKPLTMRYKDYRLKGGPITSIYQSPFYYQYEDGRDEWTLFLCFGYCISLNANLYDATYTTASGNTEGFKISVKNGDLYFDVYREGVIDESIVLSSGFGIESYSKLRTPVKIQYLIINSNGQINGEQKFKPIIANGEPTFPQLVYATVGDTDLNFSVYDYCIYSGIKKDLENFRIMKADIGKVEMSTNDYSKGVIMKARGNIYFATSDNAVKQEDFSFDLGYADTFYSTLYTGAEQAGANHADKLAVRKYIATAYGSDGMALDSTTQQIIQPTKCIKKNLDISTLSGELNVYTFQNDETIFLFYKNFIALNSWEEKSLCKVMDASGSMQYNVVLIPDTGFKIKGASGTEEYQLMEFNSAYSKDCVVAINKTTISVYYRDELQQANVQNMPTNPTIQVNSPTDTDVNWAITHIAVSDCGKLTADKLSKTLVDKLPYEES